ncbi:UNVERIFIED_CONTAM: BTB/POZ domain-containing protein [Sesamum calycinum]|uniref:BTB/POZ domain-containing protein n=1 Tax=Sesamum calycinum TaxID=2727403 RepID=A0AAW2SAR1_9LAMI
MGVVTVAELKPSISGKRSFRPSSSARHVTEWPISDVSSDLTIEVGTASFALHKFPLVSRSGRIRKLLSVAKDSKISRLNLSGVPGGSQAFELAAKFCYGVNIEITVSNVGMLRCAAHFLEMTEEFSDKNLEARTEVYLKDTVLPSIPNSITVLHHCEGLLPTAEEINLASRLINGIANNACKEQLTSGLSKLEHNFPSKHSGADGEIPWDWWGKSLALLSLDFFQGFCRLSKQKGSNRI